MFLTYDGTVRVERGLLDAEAVKAERAAERAAEKEEGGSADLPDSVVTDLTAHRTAALRLELARNTSVALAAVVHGLGSRVLYQTLGSTSCLGLSHTSERLEGLIRTPEEGTAVPALETLTQAWREALPSNPDEFWGWCLAAGDQKLLELLALLAGHSVNAVAGYSGAWGIRHADQLAEALSLDMAAHWKPTAEGFFSRLTKPQLASLLTEAGHTEAAAFAATAKKVDGANRADKALNSTDWLPAPLRPAA